MKKDKVYKIKVNYWSENSPYDFGYSYKNNHTFLRVPFSFKHSTEYEMMTNSSYVLLEYFLEQCCHKKSTNGVISVHFKGMARALKGRSKGTLGALAGLCSLQVIEIIEGEIDNKGIDRGRDEGRDVTRPKRAITPPSKSQPKPKKESSPKYAFEEHEVGKLIELIGPEMVQEWRERFWRDGWTDNQIQDALLWHIEKKKPSRTALGWKSFIRKWIDRSMKDLKLSEAEFDERLEFRLKNFFENPNSYIPENEEESV